jgi:hypothetical protein
MVEIVTPETLGKKILLNFEQLKTVKDDYEPLFVDIGRFVNPRRELIKHAQRFDTKGQRRGRDVYDGSPNSALNVWADGMQGFMVAQSLKWFKSEMDELWLNDLDEVRQWLQDYDEAMYAAFRRSNFYAVNGEWFRDAGSIGTATLYTEEDIANESSVHIPIHPREVFIAENKLGEVDTIYRHFKLTARQAVQKFDKNKLSDLIVKNASEHPQEEHEFIHAVFPNNEPMFGKLTSKRFSSVYVQVVEKADKKDGYVLRQGGYNINPYAVWRLRKNSDEVYGYSQAADAMTEIYSLQTIGKYMLKAAQMSVDPALNVPEEMRGHVKIEPHGYNYTESPERIIKPIHQMRDFPIGIDREERLQKILEDKYRVEFFLTLARSEREMTATEIMERQSEKAVLMGPQVDRLIHEGLIKVFDIVSDIEDRAGRLPNPDDYNLPDEFYEDGKINIRFTGPLAQAQERLFKLQPIRFGMNEIAPVAAMKPEVLDRINFDELAEEVLKQSAFPQHLIRSDEEVAEIQDARAKQQQAQQMLEMAGAAADAVPKLSKPVEEGSPLETVMGA